MKRSLKDYLITLVAAVVVFAVVAFFLIGAAESLMGAVVEKVASSSQKEATPVETAVTQTEETPAGEAKQKDNVVTFLVLGLDKTNKNADAVFLVGINATKNKATVALIPSNTRVQGDGIQYALGELYSGRSVNYMKDFVKREIGVEPDYYLALSMDGLSNMIDFLGGIQFNVPENMYYFDPTQNFKINLKAGNQLLSGDGAIQLLSYRGSGTGAREDVQISFAKTFCGAFLQSGNLSLAKSIFYNVVYNADTDFTENDLSARGSIIFNFAGYSQSYGRIPGATNSDGTYSVSASKARTMFEAYQ